MALKSDLGPVQMRSRGFSAFGVALAALASMRCASAKFVAAAERAEERTAFPRAASMGALPKFSDPAAAGTWVPNGPAPILTLFTVTGIANGRVTAVAVSPSDERIVLMGGDGGGIWRSEDGGATFQFAAETEGGVQAIEFSPIDPLLAYAVVNGDFSIGSSRTFYDGSFLRSTDRGRNWSKAPVPSTDSSFPGVFYARVWPDPRERDRVLVTTFNAVWSSPDRGQTWSPALSCYFCDVAPFSSDPSVWLAFRSTPIGTTRAGMDRWAEQRGTRDV